MTDFVNRGDADADADARDGDMQATHSRLQEATQVAQADATQVAQAIVTEELEAPPARPDAAAEATEQPEVVAQNEVEVDKPAAGQTTRVAAEAGLIYVMNFDPNLAQVLIQGQDFVLLFADGGQIVFQNLVGLAGQGLAPFLRVGGLNIGGDVILAQARALADEQDDQGLPTLETAAGPTGPQGSGGTQYDDDFGSLISVLDPEGPIPLTELEFGTFIGDIEPIDDVVAAIGPPTGILTINPFGPSTPGVTVTPPPDTPNEDGSAFGIGSAGGFISEDSPDPGQLTAEASGGGVLTQILVRDLPTSADGWQLDIADLIDVVNGLGGSVDSSGLGQGILLITFPVGAGVTALSAPIGFTPPPNSDVDVTGVDVIVTAEPVGGGTPVQGGTLDITIPVDAIVDGTEVLVAGQVIPAGAFLVGDLNNITTDLQLTIDPFDQTSIAGAAADADAAFTQGQGDLFDGSEQVTQLVVTLSIVDPILGLPSLNFTLPSGISASGPSVSGTTTTTTFTVDQGTSFAAVQALVDSLTVTRPDPTSMGTIQVGIQTTTVETDPDGLEPNPDNNVDVDSYAFAVTFTPQPNAQFVIENVLGVIPEDTQTGILVQANIPGNCVDVVVTEVLVTGLPASASGWTFDISAIEAFVAGLAGTNSVDFDADAGTLRITFDAAAGVDDFSQPILALPPANSDVDILDLTVTATATNIVSGETTDATPFVDDVIVDAVVDGSEVSQVSPAIAAAGTTDPVSLELSLALGGDSTVGGDPGTSPPDFEAQGGTDVDESESVTKLEIALTPDDPLGEPVLDWDTSIISAASPLVTVSARGADGSISYLFDTSGLTQAQVEALVGSFGVVVTAGFAGTVDVLVESTLSEVASVADGGSVLNDSEVFDDDNVDVDQYEFQVVYRDTPNGDLTVLGQGGAFIPEDTQTPAQVTATVADPAAGDVITEIRIEQLPTAATAPGWDIDVRPLQAAVTALGGTLVFDAVNGIITITFPTDAGPAGQGVTDLVADAAAVGEVANVLLTPPTNSDVDFPGVDVIVTATDVPTGFSLTGGTDDITLVVDAIVDGTEVQQSGADIPTAAEIANTGVSTDLGLSITNLRDSTSETGTTNPDPDADFTQGGGDVDGSETVTQVVVALSVADGSGGLPSLDFTLQAGITIAIPGGQTLGTTVTYTFAVADGTDITLVNALFESFAVEVPSADFEEDVSVDITTTTTETALNGDEPNVADNVDVDSYSLTVSFAGTPNGNLNVLGQAGAFIPEDIQTPAQLSATVADPASDEVLTEIRIEQLPTAATAPGWDIDVSPLQAAVNALGGTLVYDAAAGTITITFQTDDGVTDLVADAAALVPPELTNILLTPPTNSDADFPGVDVIVTATDTSSGVTATGGTDDITLVVDAIVDGTEVTGPDQQTVRGSQANGNDIPLTNLGLSINLLDQSSQVAIPDTDAPFTQGGADGDGSETVTQIVVTLTPDNMAVGLPSLGFSPQAGITVDAVNGVPSGAGDSITWTFAIEPGTDISVVDQLVQSFAVDPPADFSGDILIDVETTTTETGLPTSLAEPNTADNTDVDTYRYTLTVDPVPLPEDDPVDVNEAPNVNLTFVIDHSSSMDDDSGVDVADVDLPGSITDVAAFLDSSDNTVDGDGVSLTRLGLLKVALVELLEAYAAAGTEVNVLLVQFDVIAEVISDGDLDANNWFENDLGSVIDAILAIEIGLGTNYTDAIETARAEFPVGTPTADQNILYFLSDGKPTRGGNSGDNSIPDDDIALWEAFLSDNLMPAIAVGIGEGVGAADSDLEDVAVPNDPFDNNPLIVLDEMDLIPTLVETVSNRVEGNVLDNDTFGPDGEGTPAISQILVDGVTFTFDGTDITRQSDGTVINGSVLLVLTALGGQLEFFFDDTASQDAGDFNYIAPEVDADSTETFIYRIQDSDGDFNDASLVITVNDQTQAATANADSVITNDSDNLIEIADAWLVFNDSDPQGDVLGVASVSGLGATGGFSEVATDFLFTGGITIGQFSYQAHDFIQLSNTAVVDLTLDSGSSLTGTGAGEILIGGSSGDVIDGLGGADVLAGNAGSDTLDGGGGNDLLVGGPGADLVTGGAGSDIFQITAAELGSGVDIFVDINLSEDRVNLEQLLTAFDSSLDIGEFVQLTATTGELAVDQDGGGDSFATAASFTTVVTAGETLTVITDPDGNPSTVTAV